MCKLQDKVLQTYATSAPAHGFDALRTFLVLNDVNTMKGCELVIRLAATEFQSPGWAPMFRENDLVAFRGQ